MSNQGLVDPTPGPTLGASRTRVLELLRAADAPVSVHDIAGRTGLHPNTVRFHLDGLVEAGLAERGNADAGRPGRPRAVYRVTAEPDGGRRSYRLLAEMLTSLVVGVVEQPTHAAVQAGEAWGRYLVDRPAPSQPVDVTDALDRVTRMLTDAGFTLDPVDDTETPVLALRHCPFREIAEGHRDVVCALHLGLLQGALDEVHAPLSTDKLEPFVEPSLCLAHLGRTDSGAGGGRAGGRAGGTQPASLPSNGTTPH